MVVCHTQPTRNEQCRGGVPQRGSDARCRDRSGHQPLPRHSLGRSRRAEARHNSGPTIAVFNAASLPSRRDLQGRDQTIAGSHRCLKGGLMERPIGAVRKPSRQDSPRNDRVTGKVSRTESFDEADIRQLASADLTDIGPRWAGLTPPRLECAAHRRMIRSPR